MQARPNNRSVALRGSFSLGLTAVLLIEIYWNTSYINEIPIGHPPLNCKEHEGALVLEL